MLPLHCCAGIQAYFAWLCYFYVAMALRESVLLVNGSHIRSWWIHHHIWSAAGSLLMLSLPISSPSEYQELMRGGVSWGRAAGAAGRLGDRRLSGWGPRGGCGVVWVVGGTGQSSYRDEAAAFPQCFSMIASALRHTCRSLLERHV